MTCKRCSRMPVVRDGFCLRCCEYMDSLGPVTRTLVADKPDKKPVGLAPALRACLVEALGGEPGQVQLRDRASLYLCRDMSPFMRLDPEWSAVLDAIDEREKAKAANTLVATRDEIKTKWRQPITQGSET